MDTLEPISRETPSSYLHGQAHAIHGIRSEFPCTTSQMYACLHHKACQAHDRSLGMCPYVLF